MLFREDTNMVMIKEEDIKVVAQIKRIMEMCALIPGFQQDFNSDPEAAIKELGFDLTPKDVSFENEATLKGVKMYARFADSQSQKYVDFMDAKIAFRDKLIEDCAPSNPAMKKWRKRQVGRCTVELGSKNFSIIHVPFTLELANGCSVGCEFCGLNAGPLRGLFRYDDENAKLFRGILRNAKEIIGDAAGCATMYFATEPLDNPDYEKFLADFEECFNRTPQITTAVSTRDIDRMHSLVAHLKPESNIIYRFSLTSLEMAQTILKEFTPEELIFVELLPQYQEAPSNCFASVGRAAELLKEKEGKEEEEYTDTISCISGFKVNMVRKDIILTTPTMASKEHPTGEIILDAAQFTDADDFAAKLKAMISKHMMNIIKPSDRIKVKDTITIDESKENELKLTSKMGAEYTFGDNEALKLYKAIIKLMKDEYISRKDIVIKITQMEEYRGLASEMMFYIINRLWEMGVLELESGKV